MSFSRMKKSFTVSVALIAITSLYGNANAASFSDFLKSLFGTKQQVTTTVEKSAKKTSKYRVERSGPYEVVSVSDGDTFKVNILGKLETVRILGIDTPEKYTTRTGYEECYGKEASEIAKRMLANTNVYLEKDLSQQDRDKYGRMLRHVFMEDGTHFQYEMVKSGYAFAYPYGNKASFYEGVIAEAEGIAKKNKIGVWDVCDGKRMPVKDVVRQTKNKTDNILKQK